MTVRPYVCHPFSHNIPLNTATVRRVARGMAERGMVPIAPQLYLPQFIDEATERGKAMWLCKKLMHASTALYVTRTRPTAGMEVEIEYAAEIGLPIQFFNPEDFHG